MYSSVNKIQVVPEHVYGYNNNLARQDHGIVTQNYGRKETSMEDSDVMYYEAYRPLHGPAETVNIQDRMLHDKIQYAIHTRNRNISHQSMVPSSMYFSHSEYAQNYVNYMAPLPNVEYNYERTKEHAKVAVHTSMDYGYSSYCSSEETQRGLYECVEGMGTSTFTDDDEVFYLEMSDEKAKGKRPSETFDERALHEPAMYGYKNYPSTSNRLESDTFINGGMEEIDNHQVSPQTVPQSPRMSKGHNMAWCNRSEFCYISPKQTMLSEASKNDDLCSKSYEVPIFNLGSPNKYDSAESHYGVVPSTPRCSTNAIDLDTDYSVVQQFECNGNLDDVRCYEEIKVYNAGADSTAEKKSEFKYSYSPEDSSEYAIEVYLWKRSIETRFQTKDILKLQNDVTAEMRHTLLHWLVAVNRQFQFTLETWCLTVNIMDRFLTMQPLNKDCLQLVGLTAFFIAAKAEEVDPPEISELVSLCARSYEPKQFRWMEIIILTHLKFQLMAPTLNFFVFHLIEFEMGSKESAISNEKSESVKNNKPWPIELTRKLVERVLCEERLARMPYSMLAHSIFEFLTKEFILDCHDEIDACSKDEMFVDSYFKMLYVAILDQYEDDDL